MKKLLALILCVMMFVSVISTSAFADYDHEDQSVWRGESQIKDVIDALKTNTTTMYGVIAADTAVYQGVKAIDGVMKDLVDEMMKNYAPSANGTSQPGSVISDAVIAGLRRTIGGEISDYLTKHRNDYYVYDGHGNRILDPAKYAGVFAAAASNAVSSKKAVAGIQSYMYYILQRSTYEKVADQYVDLMNDVTSWGNWAKYGFDDLAPTDDTGAAMLTGPHMPGLDIDNLTPNKDGTMHDVHHLYQEYLTPYGMVGADIDGNGVWNTGVTGRTWDIEGFWVPTVGTDGKGSENSNTPLWHDNLPADGTPDDWPGAPAGYNND